MFLRGSFSLILLTVGLATAAYGQSRPETAAVSAKVPVVKASAGSAPELYLNIAKGPLFHTVDGLVAVEAKVDESALRYYAAQKNKKRVEAEIRRLKILYPAWSAPSDLYTPAGTGNGEQPLWDIFATGDMKALRSAIASRMAREASWKPSFELIRKIDRKEAEDRLIAASNDQKWTRVLQIADAEPNVLACSGIDAVWRTAEAFVKTDLKPRAFELYKAILSNCIDHDERLATARKSVALFSTVEVKILIGLGAHSTTGEGEFDSVKIDLIRARLGAVAASQIADDLTSEELNPFADAAMRTKNLSDETLLGWYWFGKQKWGDADTWFKMGLAQEPNAKLAEGHALALRNLGVLEEAKKVALDWRDRSAPMRALYIGLQVEELTRDNPLPVIAADSLTQFINIISIDHNELGAQAIAWYRYNRGEWAEASIWFKTSIDWAQAAVPPVLASAKTIEGMALALQYQNKLKEAAAVAYAALDRGEGIRALYINIMTDQLNRLDNATAIAPHQLERFGALVSHDRSVVGAQALAWYYGRTQAWAPALDWFKSAIVWSPDGKGDVRINEGYVLALKGVGRLPEAEDIAYEWRDRSAQMRSVFVGIMVDQMSKPDAADKIAEPHIQRFAALVLQDRVDAGAQALGWFRYQQNGCGLGTNWFKLALDWSPERRTDAKTNEGYAATLRRIGRLAEAEAVTYPFVASSEPMKKLYTEIVVEELTHDNPPEPVPEQRLANFVAVISPDMNPLGAQALGWYRLERHEGADSVKWFREALDWWPAPDNLVHSADKTLEDFKTILAKLALMPEQYRKSPRAYINTATLSGRDQQSYVDTIEGYTKTMEGYALALRDSGDITGAETIAFNWRDRSHGLRDLFIQIAVYELTRDNSMALIEPERMTRFVALIEADHSITGAQALAWHASARKQWEAAANWFKVSLDWAANTSFEQKVDAKIAEGYVAALRNLGRLADAEKLAFDWRERSPALRRIYIETAMEQIRTLPAGGVYPADRFNRLANIVALEKTTNGAQVLGWYLYARKDYEKALGWFKSATAWTADGKGDPKSMEGYVSSLKAMGHLKDAAALAYDWRDSTPEFHALYINTLIEQLSVNTPDETITADALQSFADIVRDDHSAAGAQALGWYRIAQKGHGYAVDWFKSSIDWSNDGKSDAKTNEGYALALRSIGRLAEAETVVYPWVGKSEAMRSLYVNIVADEMTRDVPPEPISETRLAQFVSVITSTKSAFGAQTLGWYRHNRKEEAEAAQWFKFALDWWPATASLLSRANPVVEDYQPLTAKLAMTLENYRRTPRAFSVMLNLSGKPAPDYIRTAEGYAKTWEGYARSLRGSNHPVEAEQIAYDWRDKSVTLRKLYIDMAVTALSLPDNANLSPERLAHFVELIAADHTSAGAQAVGWYHNGRKQWPEAINWFKSAIDWRPIESDAKVDAKLYEGYITALRGDGRVDEAFALAADWREKTPELKQLYVMSAIDVLQNAKASPPANLLDQLSKYADAGRSVEAGQALGWYFYGTKDYVSSLKWFQNAVSWSPAAKVDGKAIEGYVLSLRAQGKPVEAMAYAYEWRDRADNMRELYIELAADLLSKDGVTVSTDVLTKTLALANADHNSKGAQALGWYNLSRKDFAVAVDLFKNAIAWTTDAKGDAKLGEGYARALRGAGRLEDAETVAYNWSDDSDTMRSLYIEIAGDKLSRATSALVMNDEALKRFATAVIHDSSANGAQSLGWYSYNMGQMSPAVAWFDKSLAFGPSEGAAVGLALTYKKMRDTQAYQHVVETYRERFSKVAELLQANYPAAAPNVQRPAFVQPKADAEPAPVPQRRPKPVPAESKAPASTGGSSGTMAAALAKKDYVTCLKIGSALTRSGKLTAADSANMGWCLMNQGRPQESAAAFDRAMRSLTGKAHDDAAYGKSLALLQKGATVEAAQAGNQTGADNGKRNDIGLQVLSQQIDEAYRNEQFSLALDLLNRRSAFAPETRNLTMVRGWTLLKLGNYDAARNLFRLVDQQMSTSETQSAVRIAESRVMGK